MKDHYIRGVAGNSSVRFILVSSSELVEKARSLHDTSPVSTAARKGSYGNGHDGSDDEGQRDGELSNQGQQSDPRVFLRQPGPMVA